MQLELDKNERVKEKREVSNIEKRGLVKEESEQNDKERKDRNNQ